MDRGGKVSYMDDQDSHLLLQDLQSPPKFRLTDSLIHYKGRLLIGKGIYLRQKLLEAIHSDPNGDHSGIQGTYQRAKGLIYWKGLKKDIATYVS